MAAFTLMNQAVTLANASNPSPNLTLTTEFTITSACSLTGIWWYSPAGAAGLPNSCCLYDTSDQSQVAGTVNLAPSWSGAAASGWVKCSYASVALTSSKTYLVAVHVGTGAPDGYGKTTGFWTSGTGSGGITSGPMVAPNFTTSTLQGAVSSGQSSLTYPTITESGAYFGTDVEVTVSTARTATASLSPPAILSAAAAHGYSRGASLLAQPGAAATPAATHHRSATLAESPAQLAAATRGTHRAGSAVVQPHASASAVTAHSRQAAVAVVPSAEVSASGGRLIPGLTLHVNAARSSWQVNGARF